jgi:hypothetical protein
VDYKTFYKSQRQWTAVVNAIGKTVDLSGRTIFRIIDEHDRQREGSAGEALDRAVIDGPPLSKRERLERDARLAIRNLLNELPLAQRAFVYASPRWIYSSAEKLGLIEAHLRRLETGTLRAPLALGARRCFWADAPGGVEQCSIYFTTAPTTYRRHPAALGLVNIAPSGLCPDQ